MNVPELDRPSCQRIEAALIRRHWGKARPVVGQPAWHPLMCHSLDVAAVGQAYLQAHQSLAAWLASAGGFPSVDALVRWMVFWLVLHDLGKFSLSFQCQRIDLVRQNTGGEPPHAGQPEVRHDTLGYLLWTGHVAPTIDEQGWWGDRGDWQDGAAHWARAFTGHHGQPPVEGMRDLRPHFSGADLSAALALVRWADATFIDAELRSFLAQAGEAFETDSRAMSCWAAGVAVLADWIGSDTTHFPYAAEAIDDLDTYWAAAKVRAGQALLASGVLPARVQGELPFSTLFPSLSEPSPLQRWAAETPVSNEPSIVLLEDVTGAGKTEAALMLAHRMMAAGAADGFFIGLPSMATANAMYVRVVEVFQRLFPGIASLTLAHGRKDLVEAFARTVLTAGPAEADPAQDGDESATARCTRWLADHNKRALLAQAGVGTVDQALLAALQSKHQSLRLVGLFRKVLVVDEVHACDAYMQRTLEALLLLHARAGGSVILLSATLPRRMKAALLSAYAKGRGAQAPAVQSVAYPLVTRWPVPVGATAEQAIATRPAVARRVEVRALTSTQDVAALIGDAVRQGRCVVWIRNTVADLLAAEALLGGIVPSDQLTVFHARFTLGDRLRIEDSVLAQLGAASGPADRRGRVLLANQVAEQSLDICADVLISDLAPIDRLLQRAGRLHRHARSADGRRLPHGEPDQRGVPTLWVLAPAWSDSPGPRWYSDALPKAAYVYPDHGQLWLTLQQLRRGHYRMPEDARDLVEAVFGDDAMAPEGLQGCSDRAMGQAYSDRAVAQGNSLSLAHGYRRQGVDWLSDRSAPSRLGEDTHEVVLACRRGEGAALSITPWCGGREHAWEYSTVRLPRRLIAEAVPPADADEAAAVEDAKASLPGGGRHAVLLVLRERDGRWVAEAVGAARGERPGETRFWIYDAHRGLLALEQSVTAPS